MDFYRMGWGMACPGDTLAPSTHWPGEKLARRGHWVRMGCCMTQFCPRWPRETTMKVVWCERDPGGVQSETVCGDSGRTLGRRGPGCPLTHARPWVRSLRTGKAATAQWRPSPGSGVGESVRRPRKGPTSQDV